MKLSRNATLFSSIACVMLGMPAGFAIGYLARGGAVEEIPTLIGYSFLSPIGLVSPIAYSSDDRVFFLTGLVLFGGSLLAVVKRQAIWLMVCALGGSIAIGVGWGRAFCDALSA